MAGREGRLVDIDTGVLRQDRVLVQPTPGAVLFLGLGPRAQRLCRFAFGQESEGDPFIARCLRIVEAVESGRLAKAQQAGMLGAVLAIEDLSCAALPLQRPSPRPATIPMDRATNTGAGRAKAAQPGPRFPSLPMRRHTRQGKASSPQWGEAQALFLAISRRTRWRALPNSAQASPRLRLSSALSSSRPTAASPETACCRIGRTSLIITISTPAR